jgi:uric acid-xanthine permease
MPVFLALLLGFQHALSMLAGIITPPIILGGAANFPTELSQYLVSTSLIVCGILSSVQITRFHIYGTPYFIGTGLISVVGTSFATIPVATGALAQMYKTGFCPSDSAGNQLSCPQGYGEFTALESVEISILINTQVQLLELSAVLHFLKS